MIRIDTADLPQVWNMREVGSIQIESSENRKPELVRVFFPQQVEASVEFSNNNRK